jgi:hypothetical protein
MLKRTHTDQSGEVIGKWLIQLLVFMAVIALVGYEFLSIAFTWFALDDPAREVATAAANAMSDADDLREGEAAALEEAEQEEVEFVSIGLDGDFVTVVVRRRANTLLLHRISEGFTTPSVDGRARWRQ